MLVPPQYHSAVHFVAGGAAEFCSSILFVPFDVVRSRLQLGSNPNRATGGVVADTKNFGSVREAFRCIRRIEVHPMATCLLLLTTMACHVVMSSAVCPIRDSWLWWYCIGAGNTGPVRRMALLTATRLCFFGDAIFGVRKGTRAAVTR